MIDNCFTNNSTDEILAALHIVDCENWFTATTKYKGIQIDMPCVSLKDSTPKQAVIIKRILSSHDIPTENIVVRTPTQNNPHKAVLVYRLVDPADFEKAKKEIIFARDFRLKNINPSRPKNPNPKRPEGDLKI